MRRLLVALTMAALLALPAFATAAPRGANVTAEVDTLIEEVSANALVPFTAYFQNGGPSTLNHVTFEGTTSGATFEGSSHPADCAGDGASVTCQLGQFITQHDISLTFYFRQSGEGTSITFDGRFLADAVKGKPGARPDGWSDSASVDVDPDTTKFRGWQRGHENRASLPAVVSQNQTTETTVGPVGNDYAVSILHSAMDPECDALVEGDDYFGEAVELDINDGDASVELTISYLLASLDIPAEFYDEYTQELLLDAFLESVHVVHVYEGVVDCLVPFEAECDEDGAPCFSAIVEDDYLILTIHLPHNGSVKGFLR
jgi:hypothetical protein